MTIFQYARLCLAVALFMLGYLIFLAHITERDRVMLLQAECNNDPKLVECSTLPPKQEK